MRFHVPTHRKERPHAGRHEMPSRHHPPEARNPRATIAGVVSLLFLIALTILLVRRAAVRPAREPAAEPALRPSRTATPDQRRGHYYTVRPNDTLEGLARRFYHDPSRWADLARANDIRDPRRLEIGRQLWIPAAAP